MSDFSPFYVAAAVAGGVLLYCGADGIQKHKMKGDINNGTSRLDQGVHAGTKAFLLDKSARYTLKPTQPTNYQSNEQYNSPADVLAEEAAYHQRCFGEGMGGIGQAVTSNSVQKQQLSYIEQHQHRITFPVS